LAGEREPQTATLSLVSRVAKDISASSSAMPKGSQRRRAPRPIRDVAGVIMVDTINVDRR